MKNKTSFEKGMVRRGLDMVTVGDIGAPFHKNVFKSLGLITNWDVVEKPFLKMKGA